MIYINETLIESATKDKWYELKIGVKENTLRTFNTIYMAGDKIDVKFWSRTAGNDDVQDEQEIEYS